MDEERPWKFWVSLFIATLAVVIEGLSFWVQLLHEKAHDQANYMPLVWSALLTLTAWSITVVAVVKNWRDANRAKSLHAQIISIKDDYETQLVGLRRQLVEQSEKATTHFQKYLEQVDLAKELRVQLRDAITERDRAAHVGSQPSGQGVTVVNTFVAAFDPKAVFPLKCYAEMRNDSDRTIDVSIFKYTPQKAPLRKFVTDVMQVKFRTWTPTDEGVERLAVYPGQHFRAWVGPDPDRFSDTILRELLDHIGTLTLRVDGQELDIQL